MGRHRRKRRLGALLIPLLGIAFMLVTIDRRARGERDRRAYEEENAAFFVPFRQARELVAEDRSLESLDATERAVAAGETLSGLKSSDLVDGYALKAEIHYRLWQYVDAESALESAIAIADAKQRDLLQLHLGRMRDVIDRSEVERDEYSYYLATRSVGPAGALIGRVVIAYVFVDAGGSSSWSAREKSFAIQSLKTVEAWFSEWADSFGRTDLEFVERIYTYDRDPWLKHGVARLGHDNSPVGFDLARRVASSQREGTVNRFLRRLATEELASQAVLLLHIRRSARSYAVPCQRLCFGDAEYAYLLEQPRRNSWEGIRFTQAHEALHLFGADDLYNITGGRDYAPRDVMHRRARYLAATTIDSLTAYAIGWTDRVPNAPFPILTLE